MVLTINRDCFSKQHQPDELSSGDVNLFCEVRIRFLYIICVLYGSYNKQQLFPYTALTGGTLQWTCNALPLWYELSNNIGVMPVTSLGLNICYTKSCSNTVTFVLRYPVQFGMFSLDSTRPTFNYINHEWHASIFNLKLWPLYSKPDFTRVH
jgi:hypothetical protein